MLPAAFMALGEGGSMCHSALAVIISACRSWYTISYSLTTVITCRGGGSPERSVGPPKSGTRQEFMCVLLLSLPYKLSHSPSVSLTSALPVSYYFSSLYNLIYIQYSTYRQYGQIRTVCEFKSDKKGFK